MGFFVPRWWWPAASPVVGIGIIALSLAVSIGLLPDPSPDSSDGTIWIAVLFAYLMAGGLGIVTALTVVVIRRV